MTVRDWLSARASAAPSALHARVLELLGESANLPAARATTVFIETARDSLQRILGSGLYGRDGALDLLAADALMTYAYEHAAEGTPTVADLEADALRGAARLGTLSPES